uniref:Uncharacterized protein n=1 Tax=Arundo donax TaxID=35708 RepID=A0A0A9A158_ARUDO
MCMPDLDYALGTVGMFSVVEVQTTAVKFVEIGRITKRTEPSLHYMKPDCILCSETDVVRHVCAFIY